MTNKARKRLLAAHHFQARSEEKELLKTTCHKTGKKHENKREIFLPRFSFLFFLDINDLDFLILTSSWYTYSVRYVHKYMYTNTEYV